MKKLKIPRSLVLLIVFFIMFSILIVRLFQLQIVKGQEYENNFILQTKREIVLSGARGNIYDRNGKPLATNKLANSVTFEDQETYNSDRERQLNLNSKIYQMLSFRYDEDAKICLTHHVYGRSESGFVYIDVF